MTQRDRWLFYVFCMAGEIGAWLLRSIAAMFIFMLVAVITSMWIMHNV